MRTMILLINFISVLLTLYRVLGCANEVVELRAARGRDAKIPCGFGDPFVDGTNGYVVWFNAQDEFLYRFPRVPTEIRTGTHDRVLGTSCNSDFCPEDSSLVIKSASDDDAGQYRCRIHYHMSNSVDFYVNLTLVDSTGIPRIFNDHGEMVVIGVVGPYSIGSNVSLSCLVNAGDTPTDLYWQRNGKIFKTAPITDSGLLRVDINLWNISRAEVNVLYECIAQNTDVSEPLKSSAIIKMFMPPLSVEIRLDNNYDFEVGQPRVVDCVVVGCVPPPVIVWHLGPVVIRPNVHKELHDGNYTVSSLTLTASLRNHRNELVCSAYNSHIPDMVYEDKVILNVGFRPTCKSANVTIGVVFNETATATCVVDASPEPLQFVWVFTDSKTMYTSFTKVPGFNNRYASNLTWRSRRDDLGLLLCRAANILGEQKQPCIFNISTGGAPEIPDCDVRRALPNSLRVRCKKGWNGGRPQTVHLEVVDEDGSCIKNVTERSGYFFLKDIVVNRNLTAVVYASNKWGRSKERTTYLQTLIPIVDSNSAFFSVSWLPYIESVGTIIALICVAVILTVAVRILATRKENSESNSPDIVQISEGVFHREPDFDRDERVLGTTNITVNQLAACQNQYSPSPLPVCRVLAEHPLLTPDASSQHSYYV